MEIPTQSPRNLDVGKMIDLTGVDTLRLLHKTPMSNFFLNRTFWFTYQSSKNKPIINQILAAFNEFEDLEA